VESPVTTIKSWEFVGQVQMTQTAVKGILVS
jgi:hypothetical protein